MKKLSDRSEGVLTVFAVIMAFCCYFCMYSFRKPFAASTYDGQFIGGIELKIALVLSQVVGYALSKALGIKVNSEMTAARRTRALLATVLWAELMLVAFALVPPWGQNVALFANGLSLGFVWGLVFSFLEGRRTSEILGAGLSCSYIVASGYVKSVGQYLLSFGVSEAWMPALVGLIFLPAFSLSVWGLGKLPAPTEKDVLERTKRLPMDRSQRLDFFKEYAVGLLALIALYVFVTAYRDFRDNFAAEIWTSLGYGEQPSILSKSEVPIALGVMAVLALLSKIRENRVGLALTYLIMFCGCGLIVLTTFAFDAGGCSPLTWMVLVGLGLYLCYVPYGCVLFDRTIAVLGTAGTSVFLIYLSDAAAYSGSVVTLLYKQFGRAELSYLEFFRIFSYATGACGMALVAFSGWYFLREKIANRTAAQ